MVDLVWEKKQLEKIVKDAYGIRIIGWSRPPINIPVIETENPNIHYNILYFVYGWLARAELPEKEKERHLAVLREADKQLEEKWKK
jgi:hypothetical protein